MLAGTTKSTVVYSEWNLLSVRYFRNAAGQMCFALCLESVQMCLFEDSCAKRACAVRVNVFLLPHQICFCRWCSRLWNARARRHTEIRTILARRGASTRGYSRTRPRRPVTRDAPLGRTRTARTERSAVSSRVMPETARRRYCMGPRLIPIVWTGHASQVSGSVPILVLQMWGNV